jgi:hypothetical protein
MTAAGYDSDTADAFDWSAPSIDTTRPHPARMHDFFLDGKDHFAVDRVVAADILRAFPTMKASVRESRAFLGRAVAHLAADRGVRQFIDIGSGIPTMSCPHEIAQAIAPESRFVYVDDDPIVLAHMRAQLDSTDDGVTAFVDGDLQAPEGLVADVRQILDFRQPVGLLLCGALHFVPDAWDPRALLRTLVAALPSGSFVAASHVTAEHARAAWAGVVRVYAAAGIAVRPRDADEIEDLVFRDLRVVNPGVVPVSEWRSPDGALPAPLSELSCYAGVGHKP